MQERISQLLRRGALLGCLLVGGLFILIVALSTYTPVKYGTVAVVTRFGKVTDRVLHPGLNWKVPLAEGVVTYNTQKITYEASDYPDESNANYTDYPVDTTTKDGQQIALKYTVRFSVDPSKVMWIANNIGTEAEAVEKIVKTDSRIHARNIPREFNAADLYTGNVQEVQHKIEGTLRPIFEENGLLLDEFGIRSIKFDDAYVIAVEQKQIEKEKVITEQHKAEQEQFRKQQIITKAEAEAEAQRLQQQTLTKELLMKMYLEKWDGNLPQVSGDQDLILDFKDLE